MRRTAADRRKAQSKQQIALGDMNRRLFFRATANDGEVELTGYDAGEDGEEHEKALDFQQVGFRSRGRDGKGEAVAVQVGDYTIVIAGRDRSIEPAINPDEVVIFNSTGAFAKLTKDGDWIIRPKNGREVKVADSDTGTGAVALATKADVDALRTTFNTHTHVYAPGNGTPIATAVPAVLASAPAGTTILKGK